MNILYEDNDIIVAVKPAGIESQASKGFARDMVSEIKNHLAAGKGEPYVGVVHRLDTMVEGIMVYAKTKDAAAKLSAQVRDGKIGKTYQAVLNGIPKENKGRLVDRLVKDEKENISRVASPGDRNAKEAILEYKVIGKKYTGGKQFCRVAIDLITGRHHQIRVQFASRNTPVMNDARYNPGYEGGNIALCATGLSFVHPVTRKVMKFEISPSGEEWNIFK